MDTVFCHAARCLPVQSNIPLNISFLGGGHQAVDTVNYSFDGMKRGYDAVLWQYTISGCGAVEIDGKTVFVHPGEAFLLTVPEKHRYYFPKSAGHWEFLYMSLIGPEALRLAGELRAIHLSVSTEYGSAETVELAKKIIAMMMEHSLNDPVTASKLAYEFMMTLASGSSNAEMAENRDMILKIHGFCLQDLRRDISIEAMAEFAGYSRSHFCRLFRQFTGKAPHEYLLELRINMAIRMLHSGNYTVKETADMCGFSESGYFCKVFRRVTGVTPAAFRNRGK